LEFGREENKARVGSQGGPEPLTVKHRIWPQLVRMEAWPEHCSSFTISKDEPMIHHQHMLQSSFIPDRNSKCRTILLTDESFRKVKQTKGNELVSGSVISRASLTHRGTCQKE
jgi:hypothetical protein